MSYSDSKSPTRPAETLIFARNAVVVIGFFVSLMAFYAFGKPDPYESTIRWLPGLLALLSAWLMTLFCAGVLSGLMEIKEILKQRH